VKNTAAFFKSIEMRNRKIVSMFRLGKIVDIY
jgi:hypothetical protein